MILSKHDLVIGKIIHTVTITNNIREQKTIHMIDSEGNEWYRYDRSRWSYDVKSFVIVGTVKHIFEGVIDDWAEFEDEYHLQKTKDFVDEPDDPLNRVRESELLDDSLGNWKWLEYFTDRNDAMAAGKQYCAVANSK